MRLLCWRDFDWPCVATEATNRGSTPYTLPIIRRGLGCALPADPFDELRRNAVFDDRDSEDAVIVEHRARATARLLYASVGLPSLWQCGRGSLHHRREHPIPMAR